MSKNTETPQQQQKLPTEGGKTRFPRILSHILVAIVLLSISSWVPSLIPLNSITKNDSQASVPVVAEKAIYLTQPCFIKPIANSDIQTFPSIPGFKGKYKSRFLCKVLKNRNCHSRFIADSIDLFWVLAPIYSFSVKADQLYRELHSSFKSYIESFGLKFITIEAIRLPNQHATPGKRSMESKEYLMTKPDNEPYDIQVYYYNVSYIRENLLNVAIRKLDKLAPWEYVSWIDAHQVFVYPYWWEESIYKTEKYGAVQLFENVNFLSPINTTTWNSKSIMRMSLLITSIQVQEINYGNAYAITKNTYNRLGTVYDECIATSCDCAFVLSSFPPGVNWTFVWAPLYSKNFEPWIENAKRVFNGSRHFVRGIIHHFHHGDKLFPYMQLQKAAEDFAFNASQDLQRDSNFSIYITNDRVSEVLERIILESKPAT